MSISSFDLYSNLKQLIVDGRKEKLKEFFQRICKVDTHNILTKIRTIVLMEMLNVLTFNDDETFRIIQMIRLRLIAISNMFQEYIDVYELWCNNLILYHKDDIVGLLVSFYFHTEQYDKYLECSSKYNSVIINESTIRLAIVYTKCSKPNILKVVKLLKHETVANIITFVSNTMFCDNRIVPQILIELSKLNHLCDDVRQYIESFIFQYIVDPENMKFVIQADYISSKVLIHIGLYICNPINFYDKSIIHQLLLKINSIIFLLSESELALVGLCRNLSSLEHESITEFLDSPVFLTLSRRQRSEIYIAAYLSFRDINLGESIQYLIQAMICGEIKIDMKMKYMTDLIKYFSSTLGNQTYNFYIREFTTLAPFSTNALESIISVIEISLSNQNYAIVNSLLKIISDKIKLTEYVKLAEILYESDQPDHLKEGINYLTEAMKHNSGDISHLCILIKNLSDKLQNISSRKRATSTGSRPEQSSIKRCRNKNLSELRKHLKSKKKV